eukprot:7435346-Pyramimonas_sp.AAC.1
MALHQTRSGARQVFLSNGGPVTPMLGGPLEADISQDSKTLERAVSRYLLKRTGCHSSSTGSQSRSI